MPRIAIVGAGLMGTGLARLFTATGWPVAIWDLDADSVARLVEAVPGVRVAVSLPDAAAGADLVIEAIAEIAGTKQALFVELAGETSGNTIIATNSSVIPVGVVTASLNDGDAARTVGTHFWNPPDLIPLIEVIQGPRTSAETVTRTMGLLTEAGREPVHVRRDVVPGNRLQHALWREAIALVEEGVCSPEDIDHIVKRSFGARLAVLGPLENADLVGLTLTEQIHRVVLPTLSRATEPSSLLAQRVTTGQAGAASGSGFYSGWTPARLADVRARLNLHLQKAFARGA